MSLAAAIPLIALALLAGLCAAYYAVFWWRADRATRALPTLADAARDLAGDDPLPSTCVIVPAHNEADVIVTLARSLIDLEDPAGSVRRVFVLDRCTDTTEHVLREALAHAPPDIAERFEIIRLDHCPDDWAGKTHALWRGVRDSRGAAGARLLCFADADTAFHPRCLRAAAALMRRRGLDLLSVLSTLDASAWYERIAQPAAGIELVRQFPLDLVNRHDSGRAFANGQFMLFSRDAYERLGGHEAVKSELLEDLALARRLMWHFKGLRLGVFMADGILRCRMYRSWATFQRGWKRIYTEGARRKPERLRAQGVRLRLIGTLLPVASVAAVVAGLIVLKLGDRPLGWSLLASGAAGVYTFSGAVGRAYRTQKLSSWWIVAYPIGAWLVARILSRAASDLDAGRPTAWGGRTYAREARG